MAIRASNGTRTVPTKENDPMRELTAEELENVAGGVGECTPANSYYGISETTSFGSDIVNIYEGLVFATSHVIERVLNAY